MVRHRFRIWLVLAMLVNLIQPTLADEPAKEVRVMSFNIRYGTARDGVNHWDHRKEFVVETIKAFSPDLLGTQETLGFQRDYLAAQLPEYDFLGIGRNDGKEDGEMMALYYRKERFEKLDSGHFWLSETPDKIGTKSWDSSLPRMVSWVKLRDRTNPTAPPVAYFNTHFDHQGPTARLESARLVRKQVTVFGADCSCILTGDFNAAGDSSPPYKALFEAMDERPSPLVDTFRTIHPNPQTGEGTFSGFDSAKTAGPRIDWIAVSRDWQVRAAAIDRTSRDGRTPSDHFPVTTVISRTKN